MICASATDSCSLLPTPCSPTSSHTPSASRTGSNQAGPWGVSSRRPASWPFSGGVQVGEISRSGASGRTRSEEHTSELQSQSNLVCRLLLEKKKKKKTQHQLDEM